MGMLNSYIIDEEGINHDCTGDFGGAFRFFL